MLGLVAAAGLFAAIMYPAASMVYQQAREEAGEDEQLLPMFHEPAERAVPVVTVETRRVRARSSTHGGVQHRPQSQLLGFL